jgi:hypothetical protein
MVLAILWDWGSVLKSIENPIKEIRESGCRLLNDEALAK